MRTFAVSEKNFFVKLAIRFGGLSLYNIRNGNVSFCGFFWRVVFASIIASFLGAVGLIIVSGICLWIFDLLQAAYHGFTLGWGTAYGMHRESIQAFIGVVGVLLIAVLLISAILWNENAKHKRHLRELRGEPEPQKGFIGQAWESFRTKTCIKVTLKQ